MTPRVLTVGGLDPSGGAGIGADAQTLARCGAVALPVATALTVQNRHGVTRVVPVEVDLLAEMLEAALDDGPVHAVKTGLLAAPDQAGVVGELLERLAEAPVVVDPVLAAGAGGWSADDDLVAALRRVLIPCATVVTPNLPELDRLAPAGVEDLLESGCTSVLVKGGHGRGERLVDRLVTRQRSIDFAHPRLHVGDVHGTGCALASALAAELARGVGLEAACRAAIDHVQQRLHMG